MAEQDAVKKKRPRQKDICKKIRVQMEFYFSDANLSKDRYMNQLLKDDYKSWIDLSEFTKFNKLKSLTSDTSLMAKALKKSQLLEVNEPKTHVRRTQPIKILEDADSRTVYVEPIPNNTTHDTLREIFEKYGTVAYVSLPKYRTTGGLKGFGFIEFEDVEAAKTACQELQPKEQIPVKFPINSNKQIKALVKQAQAHNIVLSQDDHGQMHPSLMDGNSKAEDMKSRKRVRTASSSQDQVEEKKAPLDIENEAAGKDKTDEKKSRKRSRDTVGDEALEKEKKQKVKKDDYQVEDEEKVEVKKSRKRAREASGDEELKEGKRLDLEKDLENSTSEQINNENKKSKKRVREPSGDQNDDEIGDQRVPVSEKDTDALLPRKKKKDDDSEDLKSKSNMKQVGDDVDENIKSSKSDNEDAGESKLTKSEKKKRNRKKKKTAPKEPEKLSNLKVISKQEWQKLRDEYLEIQKANMAALKKTLREKKEAEAKASCKDEEQEKTKPTLEFVADCIVVVTSDKPLTRKELKASLAVHGAVAYVDLVDGEKRAVVRCPASDDAAGIAQSSGDQYKCHLMTGDDEQKYWEKIIADREKRLSDKTRKKKRGRDKLIERVDRLTSATQQKTKHIVFTDSEIQL